MSQIMEKTLASLPKLLTQTLTGGKVQKHSVRQLPNQEVQIFMNFVHRARSKTHEAAIVHSELSSLQQKLKQTELSTSPVLVRNSFTKAIFCHLLGYDVTFVAIYAVNLAQQGKGYDKRLGYLLCCLLLHPHHEMVMLMMATLLRDLKSSNMADNCLALLVAGQLVGEENIPSILPEVLKKLKHPHDLVREKALHCIRTFYQGAPALLRASFTQLTLFLESRDPGVLSAVVNIFLILISENPSKYVSLSGSFLHILQQINERGFGSSYYYHMVPLPWLQINILKILGYLGSAEPKLQEPISAKLQLLIEKTKVTEPISLAILVESVLTATKITANDQLLSLCSRCVGKLLSPDASNGMRYQGLGLLISLSKVKSSFAAQHQIAVVECLADEDPAIQLRTTYLLHAMANKANVKAICGKLFEQIQKTKDTVFILDILQMISDLAERLSQGIDWYFGTYFSILEVELSREKQDMFFESVLSKLEHVFKTDDNIPEQVLNNFVSTLLQALSDPNPLRPSLLLSIQLVGVLAPKLGTILPIGQFLSTIENLLLRQETDNLLPKQNVIPRPLVRNVEGSQSSHQFELSRVQSCCLETTIKLILGGGLAMSTAKEWLQKHDYQKLIKDTSVLSCLEGLQDLLDHPENLALRSQIMFDPENGEIDTSLSFLDSLIVQDLLKGQEALKPPYLKLISETTPVIYTNPKINTHDNLAMSENDEKTMSASVSSKAPKSVMNNKWKDDDQEEFVVLNPEEGTHQDKERKKKEAIARELFVGLSDQEAEGAINKNSNHIKTKHRSFWDDDGDESTSVVGLRLHPFGVPKKAKASQLSQWQDEDIENDNVTFNADNILESSFISSQSEKVESPSGITSPVYDQFSLYSMTNLANDFENNLSDSPQMKTKTSKSQQDIHQPQVTSSIYLEYLAESSTASSEHMSMSTIDTLTDSEPEEIDIH
ncbi:unnamed protein product [Lymnaea stagnalis]|uniref:Clathrin/coatomer adaptor adaptin-like N-terminal domain-containing protein n=1 Tax=Lymnaea stagnalis TaxID=6523 RepID=A0AAV2H0K6_LYMST